jgi:uncharacterized SAM-binding protein YcdF (DUF218 family)
MRKVLVTTALSVAAPVVASEVLHWRATRWNLPASPPCGACALIVLGYPTKRNGHLHAVQKWRVQMAKRACIRLRAEKVVFSGAASRGRPTEAQAMAAYAEVLGVPGQLVATELQATSTWENVEFSLPMVASFPRIAIVSDPLHASRARRFVRAQDPRLAARLVGAGEYRPLEHCWLKVLALAYEFYLALPGPLPARQPGRPPPQSAQPSGAGGRARAAPG